VEIGPCEPHVSRGRQAVPRIRYRKTAAVHTAAHAMIHPYSQTLGSAVNLGGLSCSTDQLRRRR
jgi:hypothetical protein